MSSVAKKQKSESFYSTIREDLKDIEKNISILKDASTSLIHSEIKDHSLLCETQSYIPEFRAKLVRIATEEDFNNEYIEQL